MSMRIFVDDESRDWQVFDVVPRTDERRHLDRRSSAAVASADDEQRRGERRLSVGRTSLPLGAGDGWLCFESRGERRRLRPIPDDWTRCDEGTLSAYCRVATPARTLGADLAKSAAVSPRR